MDSVMLANAFVAEYLFSFHINAGKGDRGEVYHSKVKGAKALVEVVNRL